MAIKKYIPANIEKKWQEKWKEESLYKTDLTRENKFYVLAEYAYPSGDLHMGHWFTWSGADIFARFKRMQGYNVFFPNGFDSFGLPAEGAAIKRNIHPQDWTEANIAKMKEQYQTMGPSFDFYGDLASHKPDYYKWNQWIFLKMFEKGIAYKGKYLSNWCPVDQTVLANEAVEGGKCWRCGTEVVQKEIEQWFFKITEYADRLIWKEPKSGSKLSNGVDWPVSVRTAQNDWIGKSEGAVIDFDIKNDSKSIKVFTTRPDTIFGATFVVVAPEHELVKRIASSDLKVEEADKQAVEEYVKAAGKKSELERKENKEKTGVFTGVYAVNPVNNEEIPVWVGDYVLLGYGTGAIMAVPAHDDRDFAFAERFSIPIVQVIKGEIEAKKLPYILKDGILINSGEFNGLSVKQAQIDITSHLEKSGKGSPKETFHIHDWSVSRQRYWGTPVPIINCPDCGSVPVPESDLPVLLPYDVDFMPKGIPPLASNKEWLNVKCPKCGGDAERDPETMDTFVDSSWYFFRFLDPDLQSAPFDIDLARRVMPVNIYFGGAEHTLGHTLYSRFFTKFFKDLNLSDIEEYALRRINHGIILGPDGTKMSKSRPDSVVSPDEEVKKYGADTIRIYLAFLMPYEATGPWDRERVNGPYRFLQRVWGLSEKVDDVEMSDNDLREMHQIIKSVGEDLEEIKFNTAVAKLMEWLNRLSAKDKISKDEYKNLLLLLAPFAPHITEELWQFIGEDFSIHLKPFPKYDEKYLENDDAVVVVQVNGKVRENFIVSKKIAESEIVEMAKKSEKVNKFLTGDIKKVIFIPGKILNIVV